MDFFAEEGLSADELKALDQIFDYLNLSGDIPVVARQENSLEFPQKAGWQYKEGEDKNVVSGLCHLCKDLEGLENLRTWNHAVQATRM